MMVTIESADLQRELDHEEECFTSGVNKYRKRLLENRQGEVESRSDYGKRLVSRCVEPLSKAIRKFLADAGKGAGRKHLAAHLLPLIKPDVAAFIACKAIFNGIHKVSMYQRVAGEIGRRLEDEVRFETFHATAPGLYKTVENTFETNPAIGHNGHTRGRVFKHAMTKFKVGFDKWTKEKHLHVGSKLIDLFVESTGLVSLGRYQDYHDTRITLEPTAELMTWIESFTGHSELLCPDQQPCLIPPVAFTHLFDGGYHHERLRTPMIRTKWGSHQGLLVEMGAAKMPAVYAAVNALQSTAWKINQPMLEFVEEAWNNGVEIKDIPSKFDEPKPASPNYDAADEESRKVWAKWKMEAADIFRRNLARKSKRMAMVRILQLANKFKQEPSIYYPVRLDFRGRAYYVPPVLNPQGSDVAKSLLVFTEGKPLGERGAYWLAVTISNHFGNDKVSLDERAEWTRQNSDRIVGMANDPLADRWWTEADKPFQFLAACVEWVGFTTDGPDYVCHLPVLVDGSCNGLQHFAAMLRDEVCGKHVNLVPSDKPGDIYTEVATTLASRLQAEAKSGNQNSEWAKDWLAYGIDRKLCKRPTMVLPYGGTREAFAKYVGDHVREKGHKWGKALNKRVYFLTGHLMAAMDSVIVGPRKAMAWLREAASIASKEGLPLTWTAPTGFFISQTYLSMRNRRVKTRVGDSIIKFTLQEETKKIDGRKQVSAFSPNFVHSMDAAALMQTVNLCRERGILSFHAIHDSYGTLASDMDALVHTLKEAFVSIYQSDDVLAKLRDEIQPLTETPLPELPVKGTLNISGVMLSPYFFA